MITSIEPQAPFGEAVKRAPKKAVEHNDGQTPIEGITHVHVPSICFRAIS
jgi:hypothetical protein